MHGSKGLTEVLDCWLASIAAARQISHDCIVNLGTRHHSDVVLHTEVILQATKTVHAVDAVETVEIGTSLVRAAETKDTNCNRQLDADDFLELT